MSYLNRPHPTKDLVDRAKEYIERQWRENLTLDQIAEHVFLSPFHFQKIFKKETGETPKEYSTRIRLEAAIQMVRFDLDKSVSDVAFDSGFSSQAVFARAFRARYGVSATRLRSLSFSELARLAAWEPAIRKVFRSYLERNVEPDIQRRFLSSIALERREPMNLLYLPTTMISEEHIGDQFQHLASRLFAYDIPFDESRFYGVMQDYPLHTPLEKCRYKVGVAVPANTVVPPKLFMMNVRPGLFSVFPVRGNIDAMVRHVILFSDRWLIHGRYRRAESYFLERFSTLPNALTYSSQVRQLYHPLCHR